MMKLFGVVAGLLLCSFATYGQDSEEKTKDSDTWHWELQMHVGGVYYENPLKHIEQEEFIDYVELIFSFDLYYKGFFIQSNRRRSNPAEIDIGYQITSGDDWAFDVILKSYFEDISQSDLDESNASHLTTRDNALGTALRYSKYFDNAQYTVEAATVNFDEGANGWAVESFYSHLIPYRNWDIYLGAGVTFFSANTVNYYVGIEESDAIGHLFAYRPGAAYELEAEAHAVYPLAEDWTLHLGITKSYLSDNLNDSPIGIRANTTYIKLGVNYVF